MPETPPTPEPAKSTEPVAPVPAAQPIKPINPILAILTVLLTILSAFLVYQNYQLRRTTQPTAQTSAIPVATATPEGNQTQWKTTEFASFFSYNYPAGWHVAELWGDSVLIAMDTKPINNFPGDRPAAPVVIRVTWGKPNPDEIFQNYIDGYKSGVNITKEETITKDFGPIYYFSGTINTEIMKGERSDRFFFKIPRENDPLNSLVIVGEVTATKDMTNYQVLRDVVLSIKPLR